MRTDVTKENFMTILSPRKITSRAAIGIALAILLLATPAVLRADDKKKNAPAPKSAPSQKTPATEKHSSSGNSGGNHTTGNSGGSHNTGSTGGGHSTSGSDVHHTTNNTERTRSTTNNGTQSSEHREKHHSNDATGGTQPPEHREKHHSNDSTGTAHSNNKSDGNHSSDNGSEIHTPRVKGEPRVKDHSDSSHAVGGNSGNQPANESGKKHKADKVEAGGTTERARTEVIKHPKDRTEVIRVHGGTEATLHRRPDGRVREVHLHDTTIIRSRGGWHRTIVERPDHTRIVVNRFGHGYVQRPFVYHNREFARRTYYYNGRPYALYYRGYPYRGVVLHGYVPYRYYNPAFYGWAYHPWGRPVYYSWGWARSPWYGHYNYYFTPYSAYPSASFWLTDYLLASSLQLAYQERLANQVAADDSPAAGSEVALSPEIKQQIADEVQRQLALENSERQMAVQGGDLDMESSGLPRMLAEASPNNPRIFLVSSSLDVTDAQGQECTLTEGDVLRLTTPPEPGATSVYLQVLASKGQSCPRGNTVAVEFTDLQEMQNHMRADIDQGLQDLQTHQGGLPAPPAPAAAPPVPSAFAPIAPPADPNAASELEQQAREANKLDKEVQDEMKKVKPPR
jgi:hypothetical protein